MLLLLLVPIALGVLYYDLFVWNCWEYAKFRRTSKSLIYVFGIWLQVFLVAVGRAISWSQDTTYGPYGSSSTSVAQDSMVYAVGREVRLRLFLGLRSPAATPTSATSAPREADANQHQQEQGTRARTKARARATTTATTKLLLLLLLLRTRG